MSTLHGPLLRRILTATHVSENIGNTHAAKRCYPGMIKASVRQCA